MVDQPARQVAMRGGNRLDAECPAALRQDVRRRRRPGVSKCWMQSPATARSTRLAHGQAFFRSFRDLTATGFWTMVGMADLGYTGNTVVPKWEGCLPVS